MFRLDVLQNQWLILALGLGLVLVLGLILACLPMGRRPDGQAREGPTARPERGMPWILVLVYAVTAVWAVAYVLHMTANSPNW